MTNSSSEPPKENPSASTPSTSQGNSPSKKRRAGAIASTSASKKKPILDSDERVSLIVAFGVIGTILWGIIGSTGGGLNFGVLDSFSSQISIPGLSNNDEEQELEGAAGIDGNEGGEEDEIALSDGEEGGLFDLGSEGEETTTRSHDEVEEEGINASDFEEGEFDEEEEESGVSGSIPGGISISPFDNNGEESTTNIGEEGESSTTGSNREGNQSSAVDGNGEGNESSDSNSEEESGNTETAEEENEPVAVNPEESEVSIPLTTPQSSQVQFSDISQNYWATPFINSLRQKELITGFEDSTFKPDSLVTRADFAIQLSQMFDQETFQEIDFQDVSEDYVAIAEIDKAVRLGFMKGYSKDEFRPEQQIPRYQVLVALVTGLNLQLPANPEEVLKYYEDADQLPSWAIRQIAAATNAGLVVNYPNLTTLDPNRPATRAEVAAMLHQALVYQGELEESSSEYVVR